MKHIIKKFQQFLDTEYEIPLPKRPSKKQKQQYVKGRPGYVNPFKHQHELEQQRLLRELEQAKKRAEAKQLADAKRRLEAKLVTPPPPPNSAQPKKPSIFDTKPQITRKKPHIKLPTFSKPTFSKPKSIAIAPVQKAPEIKKPEIKHEVKKEIQTPALNPLDLQYVEQEATTTPPERVTPMAFNVPVSKKHHTIAFAVLLSGLLLVGAAASIGFSLTQQQAQPSSMKPLEAKQTKSQSQMLAEAVGKKIVLPKNEKPVSATVEDKTKLQNQKFFKVAQNGDKILIYKQNKKVYLYRPATDEVIASAPLDFEEVGGAATGPAI